jgi:hypothetical protein
MDEDEVLRIYRRKFNDSELFLHLLERIDLHVDKLDKLKKRQDKQDVFIREVADLYLLSRVLLRLEKVTEKIVEESNNYYLKKIKQLFEKNETNRISKEYFKVFF